MSDIKNNAYECLVDDYLSFFYVIIAYDLDNTQINEIEY